MNGEGEKSKLEELNESLNSPHYNAPDDYRSGLEKESEVEVKESFDSPELDEMLKQDRRQTENHPVMRKLFTFALIFFMAAVAVAAYVYFGGSNLISSKNVDISVVGPVSVSAGETVEMGITITNKNNADLTEVNMVIQYPEDTRSAEDAGEALDRVKVALGAIPAGSDASHTARAALFGQKGDIKTITIDIDYRVKGSNATFTKEKVYEVSIGSSPVTMTVTQPPSVSSGDIFTTTLTILANSSEILKNVLVKAEYPYGFSVADSAPEAILDNNVWALGDLAPGDKKTITIKGVLAGEDQEERTFRFYSGVASLNNQKSLETPLAFLSQTVGINRSSLGLSVALNGDDSASYVAPSGRLIQGNIKYKNNLPDAILGGRIEVKLGGAVLDKFSVRAQNGGFYNSTSNSIIWDSSNNPALSFLGPGDNGQVSFSFSALSSLPAGTRNSEITLSTNFSAKPQNSDSREILNSTSVHSVKVASEVVLNARSLYTRGPFKNSGPVPPKAETETTYTIALDLGNTQNDILEPKVSMTLGPNVTWLGKTDPSNEKVSYDEHTNTVTWTPDSLVSGAGFSAPGKEVFFQVSLTPSIGQVGVSPTLVQAIEFSGKDAFTGTEVRLSEPAVTTRINTDPSYVQGDETVVK